MRNDDEEATNVVGVRRGTIPECLLGRQCRPGSAAPTLGCFFTAPALPTPDGPQMPSHSRCSSQGSKYLVQYGRNEEEITLSIVFFILDFFLLY
jgi:hypothetical protein